MRRALAVIVSLLCLSALVLALAACGSTSSGATGATGDTSSSGGSGSSSGSGPSSDSGSSSTGSAGSASTSPQTISAQQAKAIMDSGDPYILVDVRTQSEYDSGHIAGAVLIPVDTVTAQAPSLLPDKSALIMVYCRSGVRATDAANQLAKLGYTNVYNLGGIISWPYGTTTD